MQRLLDYLMDGASIEETQRLGAQQIKTIGNAKTIRFFAVRDDHGQAVVKIYPNSK